MNEDRRSERKRPLLLAVARILDHLWPNNDTLLQPPRLQGRSRRTFIATLHHVPQACGFQAKTAILAQILAFDSPLANPIQSIGSIISDLIPTVSPASRVPAS